MLAYPSPPQKPNNTPSLTPPLNLNHHQVRQEAEELRHALLTHALSGEVESLEREENQRAAAAEVR